MFITEGKMSQKYYGYAIQLVNKDFFCTQCNSPIQIKQNFFCSQYITCQYCNTVNTFEPETKYVQIGWNVVNNIAALNSLDEYEAMQLAGKQTNSKEYSYKEGFERYKTAYKKYLEKFFRERIKLMPDTAGTYEEDVEVEMKKRFSV